jgi:CRISPR-associated protein Cmr6
VPLIPPIARRLHALVKQNTHPGLKLDRFADSWDDAGDRRGLSERVQKPTVDEVVELSNSPPMTPDEYTALFGRWEKTLGANSFTGTTAGPLTLHLARASALENAGICFHRIYGFVYLPGSGLKGLARAFAETVWLEAEGDTPDNREKIEAVFGTTARAGSVVFHDAWP